MLVLCLLDQLRNFSILQKCSDFEYIIDSSIVHYDFMSIEARANGSLWWSVLCQPGGMVILVVQRFGVGLVIKSRWFDSRPGRYQVN